MKNADKNLFVKKIWDFLGSRKLSVFIFVMACSYALILLVFAMIVPVSWVNRIGELLPFKVLYTLFFLNLVICEIKWIPVVIRKCYRPRSPETTKDIERFRFKVDGRGLGGETGALERYLKKRGYRVWSSKRNDISSLTPLPQTILYAYRGRFSPLGNLFFHVAFLLLFLGVWVSSIARFSGTVHLMEGQHFLGSRTEYSFASSMTNLPLTKFKVEKIVPKYWDDKLLFTDLKADVKYPFKGKIKRAVLRLSQPMRIADANVAIRGMGFAPYYVLRDKKWKELDAGYVELNIFPPGNEDHFQVPGYPHQIFVSFYPDHEMKGGDITSRSMNPVNPAYYIKIFRNRVLSYSGILKPGEMANYEGLKLSFPEFKYWGEFRVVDNRGLLFIWTAFILFGIGLVWRLIFYRREIVVIKEGDNICLYGNSDYYEKLFQNSLIKLLEIN